MKSLSPVLAGLAFASLANAAAAQLWEVGQVAPITGDGESGILAGKAVLAVNLDCAGRIDVVVGAPDVDHPSGGIPNSGAVGVAYSGLGRTFSFSSIHFFDTGQGLGGSALASGDFDNDGCAQLAIGVPGEDVETIDQAGAVHVAGWDGEISFEGEWFSDVSGVAGVSEPFDHFGQVLAMGNFNGDDYDDLVIGVPGENVESPTLQLDAGAIVVLFGSEKGLTAAGSQEIHEGSGSLGGAQANAHFGYSLAPGRFNSDHYWDLAVGVPDRDVDAGGVKENAGQVVVLYGSEAGLTTDGHQRLDDADFFGAIAANDQFGYALAAGEFDAIGICAPGECFFDLAIGIPGEPNVALTQTSVGGLVVAYGSMTGFSSSDFDFFQQDNISGAGTASETGDRFASVLHAGRFDQHWADDLAVGVPDENWAGDAEQGVVHLLFGGIAGLLTFPSQLILQSAALDTGPGEEGDRFGAAIGAADFDFDFNPDGLFGVPGLDIEAGIDSGAAQVLFGALFANGFNTGGTNFWSFVDP